MAIAHPVSPVPDICISPAPAEEHIPEPKSPFACLSPTVSASDEDSYRPVLLTPPGSHSPRRASPLSPLRPADSPVKGQGLERERFEALLRASRERNASVGARKEKDLRKEIALKQHKTKQMERRAFFLAKIAEPPSPSAAMEPKTPPESPAILHYSLPSPGLKSPLAMFDQQRSSPRKPWVEQVDFRLPEGQRTKRVVRQPLPSLEQISARLNAQRQAAVEAMVAEPVQPTPGRRLPAFLKNSSRSPPREASLPLPTVAPAPASGPPRLARLQIPRTVRTTSQPIPSSPVPTVLISPAPIDESCHSPPKTPASPKLRVTTTIIPRSTSVSPIELTESNLRNFNTRARSASSMLTTLRRRALVPGVTSGAADEADVQPPSPARDELRSLRRQSAPPELSPRDHAQFASPLLGRRRGAF